MRENDAKVARCKTDMIFAKKITIVIAPCFHDYPKLRGSQSGFLHLPLLTLALVIRDGLKPKILGRKHSVVP